MRLTSVHNNTHEEILRFRDALGDVIADARADPH
jgi:hypothetical protein